LLDIIADLANCTKHLVLTKTIRAGAELKSTNSTVSLHDGAMDRTITIGLEDGSEYTGAVLLDDAHEVWENLLAGHGLL
jgi:activator of 2-hydroxyglutaryl-CoA dehydratase